MRRILVIVYAVFLLIMLANYLYYNDLYKKQISYIFELLDMQVQIVGLEVDETNNKFVSDLNQINFDGDLTHFFTNDNNKRLAIEKMELFFSKYENFVTTIKYFDNRKNEFTLKKDSESEGESWLPQSSILHVQKEILTMEKAIEENKRFNYYLPVIDQQNNETIGNLVVTVDFQKYFNAIFSTFKLQDYQWQWVIGDGGNIIYDNYGGDKISYSDLDRISNRLDEGSVENITHHAVINDKNTEIISSYYSTQLLQRNLGLVFSAPTDFFQKYIIRNSLFIVLGTLFMIQVIIFIFWRYLKSQKKETERLHSSEKMLLALIEEMPVGVIIHNRNREIIKANRIAAELYSYTNEAEMQGKIFPETKYQGGYDKERNLDPEQFVIIKKEIGEIVIFRKSIPVTFMGEDGTLELLIDVTLLESARKNEAKANVAKSEFLARMSYEIRTPLNGIIGMTDVLAKNDLSPDVKEIVRLLRRSTEVLLNIINDILDFSKIETGRMMLDEVPFNLREEIYYSTDLAKTNIPPGGTEIVSVIEDNVPESIIGDPFRLRQVLSNLLNHSVKNTDRGEIRLRCFLKGKKDGIVKLGFEIADTGTSFDKSSLKKIFGDFITTDSKAVRNSEESSFGTVLAKQLVELMGGELTAESPSGLSGDSGTKIVFSVNAYSNERVVKNLDFEQIRTFSEIKTLVIAGSQNRDEEILSSLNRIGLQVSITTFMKQTVNQLKANLGFPAERYRLIIIMNDDDSDGFEAARAVWESKLSQNFVIIMISSNDRMGNYQKSITLGIDHYIVKPFASGDLVNIMRISFPYVTDGSEVQVSARKSLKILIVEDNKMNQKVLGTMLKNLGYSHDIAEDGYTGYLQAKDNRYDLIFMDLVMPEMDGFEATRRILSIDKSVVVVAFTADNMPETKKKAELSGISDFISKPVRIDDLKRVFARHFSN